MLWGKKWAKLHEGDEIDVSSKTNYVKGVNEAKEQYTALFTSTKYGNHLSNTDFKCKHELSKEKRKIGQKNSKYFK